jgi:hypothetical protein
MSNNTIQTNGKAKNMMITVAACNNNAIISKDKGKER